jgi:hypothetical protein
MKIIGLVGEDPNDTESIKALLSRKFPNCRFKHIIRGLRGWQLDNKGKFLKLLSVEIRSANYHKIIFIRDLDALKSHTASYAKKKKWFDDICVFTKRDDIFLLNIYELEALILADIKTFNLIYKSSILFPGNPTFKEDPKGFLIQKTEKNRKTYRESDCPEIFAHLDIEILKEKCQYFKEFLTEFENKLKN